MLTDPRLGTTLPALITSLYDYLRRIAVEVNGQAVRVRQGAGSPEGVIVGNKGDLWQRTDGGAGTCLYVFEGTSGTAVGWVAK